MKKFGFVVLGLVLAVGVSAQVQQPGNNHYVPQGNDANLNQVGYSQWGFIYQWGDNNVANINQGMLCPKEDVVSPAHHQKWSNHNTAFLTQIGFMHDGTINQTGHGNYASLLQWGWKTKGEITQSGKHNITAVMQLPMSELNINQSGSNNFIGGAGRGISHNFCGNLEPYSYEQSCPVSEKWFKPLVVAYGETVNIEQGGNGNFFFGVKALKGDRKIWQGNTIWDQHPTKGGHHSELDMNAIWLEQAGGMATLTQNGKYNRIWLDIDVIPGTCEKDEPTVTIIQEGYKNMVAKFNGPCCCCHEISGPAEFNGDEMTVKQHGYKNRLSVDSKGMENNIHVTQTGMYNYGSIVQSGMMPHHP